MFLRGGFTATGSGDNGAVRLSGTHIGGQLACTGASLENVSGPALHADKLQVDRDMFLRDGFAAIGGGDDDDDVAVDLTGARVGGAFLFAPARLEHADDPHRRLLVDGLIYPGVPELVSARGWLRLLRDGTPAYAAQPYQQLAAGCRALGDERHAREVLMAQRDDELARTQPPPGWTERLWGRTTKVTLGYGYQPWRALLFLAGVVALSCVLAVALGGHGALAQAKDTAAPGQPCTVIQRVSVGLDLNLPVGTSLARAGCGLPKDTASATAAWQPSLAGRCGAGVGVRGAVHRWLHRCGPQDLTAPPSLHPTGCGDRVIQRVVAHSPVSSAGLKVPRGELAVVWDLAAAIDVGS